MVKIAVLLTGRLHPKKFDKDNINKNINTIKLIGDDITIFCSLNKSIEISEYTHKFREDFNITDEQINIEDTQEPSELYKYPKAPASNYHRVYSMFYHNKRAFELLEKYKTKYNIEFSVIIKFRGDLKSNSVISLNNILDNSSVYIPNGFDYGGINDQIAYGNFDIMKNYCELGNGNVEKLHLEKNIRYHPETLLFHHLKSYNISITRPNFSYNLDGSRR